MADYWYIKDGITRLDVKPMQQNRTKRLGPITVYRDRFGVTYSGKYIKTWDELTPSQQIKAYRDAYQNRRAAALWEIKKDPTLSAQYPSWLEQLKQERDDAIQQIESGKKVSPPRRIWE